MFPKTPLAFPWWMAQTPETPSRLRRVPHPHPHAALRSRAAKLGPGEPRHRGRPHRQAAGSSCWRLFYSETGLVARDGLDFYRLPYFPDDLFMGSAARSSLEAL